MAKLTKKSHKRRRIVTGLFAFIAIALISTGFASWVMSTDSQENIDGGLNVGAVAEGQIEFKDITVDPEHKSFSFEPKQTDNTGRVRAAQGTDAKFENLTVTITGKITNLKYLGEFNLKFDIPEKIEQAAAKSYIVLPVEDVVIYTHTEGVLVAPNGYVIAVNVDETNDILTFEIVINFSWGEKFNGKNPGEYFDEDPEGLAYSDSEVKDILNDFYDTVHLGEDDLGNPKYSEEVAYQITLNAKSN